MAWTTEPIAAVNQPASNTIVQDQFDLPSVSFTGYDKKGTTSVTGSPIVRPESADTRQDSVVVEPTAAAATPTPEESVAISGKASVLLRKEQATRQREQALAKREKELEAKLADAEKYNQLKSKIASKDFTAVKELGVTYDEFLKSELDSQTAKDPAEQRFKKVEDELSSFKKQQEENEAKEYQANQALWKQEISKVITENEEFSTIKELAGEDAVLQHINDSFEEDGIELTVEQAAKEIEDALVARAEKFANITKIKNKVPEAKVLGPPKTSAKTITQQMTTTPTTAQKSKPFHLMSESEQIAEAIRKVNAAKIQR